jgi:hypothetical protein
MARPPPHPQFATLAIRRIVPGQYPDEAKSSHSLAANAALTSMSENKQSNANRFLIGPPSPYPMVAHRETGFQRFEVVIPPRGNGKGDLRKSFSVLAARLNAFPSPRGRQRQIDPVPAARLRAQVMSNSDAKTAS